MEDFYNKMVALKAVKRLKWREIGSVIAKGESTIRTAFERRSLSPLEMRELAVYYDLDMDFSNHDKKIRDTFKEEPADYINTNIEDIIAEKVEKKLQQHFEVLENLLSQIIMKNSRISKSLEKLEKKHS